MPHVSTTSADALRLAWFFEDLNVEAEEFSYKVILDHLLVIEERLLVEFDSTLQLTVFGLGGLPVLFKQKCC